MNAETKTCQSCQKEFVVEPEDFAFYARIDVPPPTFCAECRLQRRLSFCNERNLYKNNCGSCGKAMIAMYPPKTVFPVHCLDCYRSDSWDPLSYGAEYDFGTPFFEQYRKLKSRVPRAAVVQQGDANGSEYCNRASYNKNCYLLVRANYNENSLYSYTLWDSKDCVDCLNIHKSELAFQSIDCIECYRIEYCQESRQCRDSRFLFDCRNCTNCIGCAGLRNKEYYILNQKYTKNEYEERVKNLRLNTVQGIDAFRAQFDELVARTIREPMIAINCTNSTGNWLSNCNEVKDSYQSRNVDHGKNLLSIIDGKDCMDYSYWGRSVELIYETSNCGYNCSRIRFVNESWDACNDLTYCDNCYGSSNCWGCVGLKKKEYCILNKQYEKEEYQNVIKKIRAHMDAMPYKDARGRVYKFGEFFPNELSASAYNMTAAHEHFPLTKDEAAQQGFCWEDREGKSHIPTKSWSESPETIDDVGDGILDETILCEAWDKRGSIDVVAEHNCTKAFRVIPSELAFYRRMQIPIPRKCPNTRHYERFHKRTPLRLWSRECACGGASSKDGQYKNTTPHFHGGGSCPNKFGTSYTPERPEIVYCEQCYQAEVV